MYLRKEYLFLRFVCCCASLCVLSACICLSLLKNCLVHGSQSKSCCVFVPNICIKNTFPFCWNIFLAYAVPCSVQIHQFLNSYRFSFNSIQQTQKSRKFSYHHKVWAFFSPCFWEFPHFTKISFYIHKKSIFFCYNHWFDRKFVQKY